MTDQYEETFNTWNKVAELYESKFMNLDLYNISYDYMHNSILKPNAKILEIGCGPGNISKYILSKRPDFDILGIDVAPKMIELAKKNNPTAKFSVMDCRTINQLTLRFDGIVAGFCLPYLSETEGLQLINNCSRLLNENGLLYLSFVEGEPAQSGFQTGSSGDRVYFYYHNVDAFRKKFTEQELIDIKSFRIEYKKDEIHTILIARKNNL